MDNRHDIIAEVRQTRLATGFRADTSLSHAGVSVTLMAGDQPAASFYFPRGVSAQWARRVVQAASRVPVDTF